MKIIAFLRHSLADSKRSGQKDLDRIITVDGEDLAREMAKKLRKEMNQLDLAIVSPAERTKQTAEIFLKEVSVNNTIFNDNLYYGMGLRDFERLFYDMDDEISDVLIVGHNPFITQISMYFTDKYDLFLHPSSFVIVKFDIDKWIDIDKTKVVDYKIFMSV